MSEDKAKKKALETTVEVLKALKEGNPVMGLAHIMKAGIHNVDPAPAVPGDLHRTHAPDHASAGGVLCDFCRASFPYSSLTIHELGYFCSACLPKALAIAYPK